MSSRSPLRAALIAALAAFAISAVAAGAAQAATEGPFYKIGAARLAAGETKVLKAKTVEKYQFQAGPLGLKWGCSNVSYATGAKVAGSSGANAGTSEQTIEFSGCGATEGGGVNCRVENEKFSTNALKGTLGYTTETRTGKLLELLKPTGKIFANVKFKPEVGGECDFGESVNIEGSVIATVRTGKSAVEPGVNEKIAKTVELQFQTTSPKTIWTESAGALTKNLTALTFFGTQFTISGIVGQELEGLPEWGVFTK